MPTAIAEKITPEQYFVVQRQLVLIGNVADGLELDGFIQQADMAETLGPIFSTAADYQKSLPNLQHLKKMAKALKPFVEAFRELQEETVKEGGTHG